MKVKLIYIFVFLFVFNFTYPQVKFHKKLSKDQQKVMEKIYNEAKDSRIDPNFAINLAFAESSFRANITRKESKGRRSIGPMQILNTTALQIGYTEAQLENKDLNIEVGLKYLEVIKYKYYGKEVSDIVTAATYNYGIGNMMKQLKKGPIHYSDLPKSTQKYLENIFQRKFSKNYIILSQ